MNDNKPSKSKIFDLKSEDGKVLIINDQKKHSGYKLTYLNKPAI